MEYFKDKFRFRESPELCRIWEKNICCGGYLIEDAGRKEARGTRANGIKGHFGVKTFEERNDIMNLGREQ